MRKTQSVAKVPYPLPDVVTKVVPAPTEGWDAISPLASMEPKRAAILNNFVPRTGWVELRSGFSQWAFLAAATPVETLIPYRAKGVELLFAARGSIIYDVSVFNTATSVLTGLASGRWQYVSFTPANAPTVIQIVNGVDTLRQYNGTAWSIPAITGLPGGLTTAAITNISANKRRLWYVLGDGSGNGSTLASFMPIDAITGPIAGSLDIGALLTKGGHLVSIGDWAIDGGSGPSDYVVFLSSRGQAIVYTGTDPLNAQSWSLVGTFDLAPPISLRCMTRVGSDLALLTQEGVLPISQSLPFDPSADRSVAITARIQNAMSQSAASYKSNFGWQFITYPTQQLAILNIPVTENSQQVQYVMNTLTGAWCQFTGWNANCFEIHNDKLYFGGNDGTVNLAYDTSLDGTAPIQADMQCAFNYFDDPGRLKRMTMIQPLMVTNGAFSPTMSIDVDFNVSMAVAPISVFESGSLWDVALWDVDNWATGPSTFNPWLSTEAIGKALAVHMTANINPTGQVILQINAFNTIIEMGGFV